MISLKIKGDRYKIPTYRGSRYLINMTWDGGYRLRSQEKIKLGRKVTFFKSAYFGTVGSFLEMLNVPKSSMHDIVLSNLDGFYAIVTSWVVRMHANPGTVTDYSSTVY